MGSNFPWQRSLGLPLMALALGLAPTVHAQPVPDGSAWGGSGPLHARADVVDRGVWVQDPSGAIFTAGISGGVAPQLTAAASGTGAAAGAHYNYYVRAVDQTQPAQQVVVDMTYSFSIDAYVNPGNLLPFTYQGAALLSLAWTTVACGEVSTNPGYCVYSPDAVKAPGTYTFESTVRSGDWKRVSVDANASVSSHQYLQDTGSVGVSVGPIVFSISPAWTAAHPNDVVALEFATVTAVPEAATSAMWLAGLGGLGVAARRRRKGQ